MSELRRLRQLEDENAGPKRLVADLTPKRSNSSSHLSLKSTHVTGDRYHFNA